MSYQLNGLATKMVVKNRKGEILDISQLVSSVTIQGDYKQGARRLDCSYIASSKDNNIPELAYETVRVELALGSEIFNECNCPITVAKRDEVSPIIKIA